MLLTGLLTGLVLGFFSFFLIYLSGILPPIGNMTAEAVASNEAEMAAAQQRRNEELEEAATRLQLEFYKELPNYELIVDNMPQASVATVVAGTGAQVATLSSVPDPIDVAPIDVDPIAETTVAVAAVATAVTPGGPGYMIQAGAFQQETSAIAQSARLVALGLDSRVRQEALLGKTLFLVQIGPYSTRDQLTQVESVLRSNGIDSIRMGLSQ